MLKSRIEKIYSTLGYVYFSKKSNIGILEYIIFLIQYDSLNQSPFLKEKIYIDRYNIRIEYLSDLLRVGHFNYFLPRGANTSTLDKYVIELRKYMNLSDGDIQKKVFDIIDNVELNNRYFVYDKYSNKKLRILARLKIKSLEHAWKGYFRLILFAMLVGLFIAICISFPIAIYNDVYYVNIKLVSIVMIMEIILLIIYLYWTWLWMRPSKYELDNK